MTLGPSPRVRRVSENGEVRYHGRSDTSAVYRIYNAANELIYIGMSYEPATRVNVQRREQKWGHEIARYEADWFPDRVASRDAEERLIKELQPRYNVTHTPEHRVRSLQFMEKARTCSSTQAIAHEIIGCLFPGAKPEPAPE
jgi:excinuclease UvrABC nuclease subunit